MSAKAVRLMPTSTCHYFLMTLPQMCSIGGRQRAPAAETISAAPLQVSSWPMYDPRISGRYYRFVPVDFQRRPPLDRLCTTPEVIPGGHRAALASRRSCGTV